MIDYTMTDRDFCAEDLRLSLLQEAATEEEAFWIEVASALLPGALEPLPLRVDATCPDEETLIASVSGSLPASEQAHMEGHLEGCAACAARRAAVAEALSAAERAAAEFVPMPHKAFESLMARWEAEQPPVPVPPKPLWERLPFTELRRLVEQGQAEAVAAWDRLKQLLTEVREDLARSLVPQPTFALAPMPVLGEGQEAEPGVPELYLAISADSDFAGRAMAEYGPRLDDRGQFDLDLALLTPQGSPERGYESGQAAIFLKIQGAERLFLGECAIQDSRGALSVAIPAELDLPVGSWLPTWIEVKLRKAESNA